MQKGGAVRQIVGQPGHNLPHGILRIIRVRQRLQMPEQILSHIRLHPHAKDVPPVIHVEISKGRKDRHRQINSHHLYQQPHGNRIGMVGNLPYSHGRHIVGNRQKHRTDNVHSQKPLMPPDIGQQPFYQIRQPHSFLHSTRFILKPVLHRLKALGAADQVIAGFL